VVVSRGDVGPFSRLATYPVPDEELGHEAAHGAEEGPPAVYDLSLKGGSRSGRGQGCELPAGPHLQQLLVASCSIRCPVAVLAVRARAVLVGSLYRHSGIEYVCVHTCLKNSKRSGSAQRPTQSQP
jgi:hypothetical protein